MTSSAGRPGALLPSGHRDPAAACVDADDHAFAERAQAVVEEVDVAERRGAEDHALDAGVERGADRRQRAQAAAELHRDGQLARHRGDVLEVRGRAALRAVEVHHVEEARAGLDPRAGRLERRVAVDGAVLEVALDQAHGLPFEDVDGGVEDHAGVRADSAAKLASMRSPCTEDFSGWNCAPKIEPRATTLVNGVPYSLMPSTSASSSGCGT